MPAWAAPCMPTSASGTAARAAAPTLLPGGSRRTGQCSLAEATPDPGPCSEPGHPRGPETMARGDATGPCPVRRLGLRPGQGLPAPGAAAGPSAAGPSPAGGTHSSCSPAGGAGTKRPCLGRDLEPQRLLSPPSLGNSGSWSPPASVAARRPLPGRSGLPAALRSLASPPGARLSRGPRTNSVCPPTGSTLVTDHVPGSHGCGRTKCLPTPPPSWSQLTTWPAARPVLGETA